MSNLGLISNSIGTLLYLFLLLLLLVNWKGKLISFLLCACALVSATWFGAVAWHAADRYISLETLRILELARDLCWLGLLILVIRYGGGDKTLERSDKLFIVLFVGFILLFLVAVIANQQLDIISLESMGGVSLLYFFYLVLALFGLLLVEKLYQNTAPSQKWNIRYFCLGIGGIFVYDFYLYSDAMLLGSINPDLWYARGLVNALCVPLIVISIVRNPHWEANLFVSRHVVYRSIVVIAAGVYLSVMAAAGYYVKQFGGTWGSTLQIVFFFGALVILLVVIFSSQFRSSLKVALAKHFYKNKYDYREEWLNFTRSLAEEPETDREHRHVIRIIASTVDCKGGAMWVLDTDKDMYRPVDTWNDFPQMDLEISSNDDLAVFLQQKKWVIDVGEYRNKPEAYDYIELPQWLLKVNNIKLILPLINNDMLIGFIAFTSDSNETLNWEDADLLKTMGYQSASYIALLAANEQLMEAKQFETFNRLSAYVVHDIKNLVAQLSLVSANARKFRDNPEFIEDAFDTIENATEKMKRMLKSLSKQELDRTGNQQHLEISALVREVLENRASGLPAPQLNTVDGELYIRADEDRFKSVLEHLIENAQEATADDGFVRVHIDKKDTEIVIDIVDNGCGMSDEFINNHLFKPFDTTKGNAGMGIGVYESRDIIRNLNGRLEVQSTPGAGTRFTIYIPESITPQGAH